MTQQQQQEQQRYLLYNRYEIHNLLGIGTWGCVFGAIDKNTSMKVGIKFMTDPTMYYPELEFWNGLCNMAYVSEAFMSEINHRSDNNNNNEKVSSRNLFRIVKLLDNGTSDTKTTSIDKIVKSCRPPLDNDQYVKLRNLLKDVKNGTLYWYSMEKVAGTVLDINDGSKRLQDGKMSPHWLFGLLWYSYVTADQYGLRTLDNHVNNLAYEKTTNQTLYCMKPKPLQSNVLDKNWIKSDGLLSDENENMYFLFPSGTERFVRIDPGGNVFLDENWGKFWMSKSNSNNKEDVIIDEDRDGGGGGGTIRKRKEQTDDDDDDDENSAIQIESHIDNTISSTMQAQIKFEYPQSTFEEEDWKKGRHIRILHGGRDISGNIKFVDTIHVTDLISAQRNNKYYISDNTPILSANSQFNSKQLMEREYYIHPNYKVPYEYIVSFKSILSILENIHNFNQTLHVLFFRIFMSFHESSTSKNIHVTYNRNELTRIAKIDTWKSNMNNHYRNQWIDPMTSFQKDPLAELIDRLYTMTFDLTTVNFSYYMANYYFEHRISAVYAKQLIQSAKEGKLKLDIFYDSVFTK